MSFWIGVLVVLFIELVIIVAILNFLLLSPTCKSIILPRRAV